MTKTTIRDIGFDFRQCDAFELFASLENESIDFIAVDPPYGMMDVEWDSKAPDWDRFWAEANRVTKPGAVVCVFGMELMLLDCIQANRKNYRYRMIWEKTLSTGMLNAAKRPLQGHEEIAVFCRRPSESTYHPQRYKAPEGYVAKKKLRKSRRSDLYRGHSKDTEWIDDGSRLPSTILTFASNKGFHPTQKPEDLMEFLILSYTNPGDTVLDTYAGSGTTGVAAIKHHCHFIGSELSDTYYTQALERLKNTPPDLLGYSRAKPIPQLPDQPENQTPVLFDLPTPIETETA